MHTVFLSYARVDRKKAEQVARTLELAGLNVWWDTRLTAGENFDDVISAALNSAKCVVVLWSSKSVQSKWVKDEAHEGERSNRLIPVLIDAVLPPFGFRRVHAVDLTSWSGSHQDIAFRGLMEAISAKVGFQADTVQTETKRTESLDKSFPTYSIGATPLSFTLKPGIASVASKENSNPSLTKNGNAGARASTSATAKVNNRPTSPSASQSYNSEAASESPKSRLDLRVYVTDSPAPRYGRARDEPSVLRFDGTTVQLFKSKAVASSGELPYASTSISSFWLVTVLRCRGEEQYSIMVNFERESGIIKRTVGHEWIELLFSSSDPRNYPDEFDNQPPAEFTIKQIVEHTDIWPVYNIKKYVEQVYKKKWSPKVEMI